jgi:hypothetical protein
MVVTADGILTRTSIGATADSACGTMAMTPAEAIARGILSADTMSSRWQDAKAHALTACLAMVQPCFLQQGGIDCPAPVDGGMALTQTATARKADRIARGI